MAASMARINFARGPWSARRAEDVVLTRDRRAEGLELIDTGVQVGFVREDVLLGR